MLCDAGYPTCLLGTWVHERQAMPLEHEVQRLTAQLADLFGIKDRGRLKPGYSADMTILDPATISLSNHASAGTTSRAKPSRMVMPSRGVE